MLRRPRCSEQRIRPARAGDPGSNEAAVAITDAPEREAGTLQSHLEWFYRKIRYNDLVVVRPPGDPANVAGSQMPMKQ